MSPATRQSQQAFLATGNSSFRTRLGGAWAVLISRSAGNWRPGLRQRQAAKGRRDLEGGWGRVQQGGGSAQGPQRQRSPGLFCCADGQKIALGDAREATRDQVARALRSSRSHLVAMLCIYPRPPLFQIASSCNAVDTATDLCRFPRRVCVPNRHARVAGMKFRRRV